MIKIITWFCPLKRACPHRKCYPGVLRSKNETHTLLLPLEMFNARPQCFELVEHPKVPMVYLPVNVAYALLVSQKRLDRVAIAYQSGSVLCFGPRLRLKPRVIDHAIFLLYLYSGQQKRKCIKKEWKFCLPFPFLINKKIMSPSDEAIPVCVWCASVPYCILHSEHDLQADNHIHPDTSMQGLQDIADKHFPQHLTYSWLASYMCSASTVLPLFLNQKH